MVQADEVLSPAAVAAKEGLLAPPIQLLVHKWRGQPVKFHYGARLSAVVSSLSLMRNCLRQINRLNTSHCTDFNQVNLLKLGTRITALSIIYFPSVLSPSACHAGHCR